MTLMSSRLSWRMPLSSPGTPASRRPRTPTRVLAPLGLSLVVFVVLQHTTLSASLTSAFLTLGLDEERAQLLTAVIGAAMSGGAGALIGSTLTAWLGGLLWYSVLFLPAFSSTGAPQPLPGERVDPVGMLIGTVGLLGLGAAAAGLGGAAGHGARLAAAATYSFITGGHRTWAVATAGTAALALSVAGILEAPDILTYGPWSGALQTTASENVGPYTQVSFSYTSATFGGRPMGAVVLLPPGYSHGAQRYPVLYLLHGTPGSDQDWARQGAANILDSLLRAGRIPPLVAVMPSGVGPKGGSNDSWADNYVPGDLMETQFLRDLMPAVAAHFRLLRGQTHTAIAGLSSGGYGAVNLALRHPNMFGLALDFSGDIAPLASAFGSNASERLANNPLIRARLPAPKDASAFFIGWGGNDPYRAENLLLSQELHASGYVIGIDTVAGRHQWSAWRQLLYDGLYRMGYLIGAEA